jgi:hypothetical protein
MVVGRKEWSLAMSDSTQNGFSNDARLRDAEQTLRLVANLPAPKGLEDRIHAGLRVAPRQARLLAWPTAMSPAGGWLRSAAAAALVCVVAGGGWGIYSRVQPSQVPAGVTLGGGFGSAGTVRKPVTLVGPAVTHPATAVTAPARVGVKIAAAKLPASHHKAANKTVTPISK